jgi:hypothetical protein
VPCDTPASRATSAIVTWLRPPFTISLRSA